ncbi:MerR family transcriptional regulator [Kribbella sp. NBC_00889]|uniref:MerR family transcriptional regulator n=1 Tax=Kribbella sp. NBC_00889 TaxID=2975974 RepID=UPI003863A31D|nr:MerR family transcriptional regulator [Kribbella sp. NBC_00889]
MKIGQVAHDAGVTVDTVRYYERRGVLPTPQRESSGYRRYTSEAADRIRLAKSLQALGFTLDEIVDALRSLEDGDATCANQRWRLEQVLNRIDTKLAHLQRVRENTMTVLEASHTGHCTICANQPVVGGAG